MSPSGNSPPSTEMAYPAPAPAEPQLGPDPRAFRDALGRFATGVAFVTAAPDGQLLTATDVSGASAGRGTIPTVSRTPAVTPASEGA